MQPGSFSRSTWETLIIVCEIFEKNQRIPEYITVRYERDSVAVYLHEFESQQIFAV